MRADSEAVVCAEGEAGVEEEDGYREERARGTRPAGRSSIRTETS